jgi:hypothetical protein
MKTQRLVVTLFALTFVFAQQPCGTNAAIPTATGQKYSAVLISPRAGEILIPGQTYRVQWKSSLPDVDPNNCETEIRLTLDGGRTFTWLTGERDPMTKYFDWVVPNTPTKHAMLDIHFGCLGYYPETVSLQAQSVFTIGYPN